MEKLRNEITLHYSDPAIEELLKGNQQDRANYTLHFNQNEEIFLKLDRDFVVPSFPVHHDVKNSKPSENYRKALKQVIQQLITISPGVFKGLSHYFDPAEILKPVFFQLYRVANRHYLYFMRLDLLFRTHEASLETRGDNDRTPAYRTRNLFLEGDLIPLDKVIVSEGKIQAFHVHQIIPNTWVGETGRGYLVQGIWMDHELTKYFSKLFVPRDIRIYPYYPFTCKYRTICHTPFHFDPEGRKQHLPHLHRALDFLVPRISMIQSTLKGSSFSPKDPTFLSMKKEVPSLWNRVWDPITIHMYLNAQDMKEFLLEEI
jgi:hypothetical protein